ncbi:hypothetical protein IMSAG049_01034 [Clostridiales bacterium]|nr:hypothetical protein IMSAG049_01034 [Clostridiales bacterium]
MVTFLKENQYFALGKQVQQFASRMPTARRFSRRCAKATIRVSAFLCGTCNQRTFNQKLRFLMGIFISTAQLQNNELKTEFSVLGAGASPCQDLWQSPMIFTVLSHTFLKESMQRTFSWKLRFLFRLFAIAIQRSKT